MHWEGDMKPRQRNTNEPNNQETNIQSVQDICGQKCLKHRYESLAVQLSDLEKLNRQVLMVQRICTTQGLLDCVQKCVPSKTE